MNVILDTSSVTGPPRATAARIVSPKSGAAAMSSSPVTKNVDAP
jgi:hypothetical protein